MSYDILYGKQFIKVDDKRVIPFVLIGSNNCYDLNNKRARDWYNTYAHNEGRHIIADNDKLLANIDKYREDTMKRCAENVINYNDASWAYDDKRWGYHTSLSMYGKHTATTSFGVYKSFFKTGIKEAMSIEELITAGVSICLKLSPYYDKEEFANKNITALPTVYLKSTQQLIDTVAEYEAYYANVKSATLWLSESGMDRYLDKKRMSKRIAKIKKRAEKKSITVNEYYVLYNGVGYLIKNTKKGYHYSYQPISGKAFINEKTANAFHKRMRYKESFEVTKIEGTRNFLI
jgi:hypothetical protein